MSDRKQPIEVVITAEQFHDFALDDDGISCTKALFEFLNSEGFELELVRDENNDFAFRPATSGYMVIWNEDLGYGYKRFFTSNIERIVPALSANYPEVD